MKNRVRHPADDPGIDRRLGAQTRYSGDAAHQRRSGAVIARTRQSINALLMADRAECRPPQVPVLTFSGDCVAVQSA
jgi:hypothetical protein